MGGLTKLDSTAEAERLREANEGKRTWRRWGTYVSERQWGTVREDYSTNGDAWNYFPHDHARSRAYRWGEDGLGGFCDEHQTLCLGLALWNGADPILKERLFGLTNGEGNHGEDVKEAYYYLDATPTYSYARMLYKYPQAAFPYEWLIGENGRRGRLKPEFELVDTGIFNGDAYFDIDIRYAKADPDDILWQITAINRGGRPHSSPCYRKSGFATPGVGSQAREAILEGGGQRGGRGQACRARRLHGAFRKAGQVAVLRERDQHGAALQHR